MFNIGVGVFYIGKGVFNIGVCMFKGQGILLRLHNPDSVTMEIPQAFKVLCQDVGYAMRFAARSILYVDY